MALPVKPPKEKEENPNPFPQVCNVEPVKVSIEVHLNRDITKHLTLINACDKPIAFKVKTTNRDRYGVK